MDITLQQCSAALDSLRAIYNRIQEQLIPTPRPAETEAQGTPQWEAETQENPSWEDNELYYSFEELLY